MYIVLPHQLALSSLLQHWQHCAPFWSSVHSTRDPGWQLRRFEGHSLRWSDSGRPNDESQTHTLCRIY